jgi:hypothetical protein
VNNTKLEAALALAAIGFRVFPLEIGGKRPAIKDWPNMATSDPHKIKAMWGDEPFNIGVATGQGLMVLDFDDEGGLLDFEDFKKQGMNCDFQVKTPNGLHVYLNHDKRVVIGNSVKKIAPHTDVRGDGGYVVGIGSVIGDKAYRRI